MLATHDQEEAFSIADCVAVMLAGRIAQIGVPEAVMLRLDTRAVARFTGCEQWLPATASGRTARCALGEVELWSAADGEVEILARPDAPVVAAGASPRGRPAS